jgi:hypothetical protein
MSGTEILAAILVTILAGLETVIAALAVRELARKRDKKWASLRSAWLRVSISAVLVLVAVDLWIGRSPPLDGVIGLILIVSFGGAVVLLLIDIGRDLARAISVRRNRPAGAPAQQQAAPIPTPAVAGLHVSGVAVQDPGWAEALKSTTPIVGPIRMMRAQASGRGNPLVALRAIYVALLATCPCSCSLCPSSSPGTDLALRTGSLGWWPSMERRRSGWFSGRGTGPSPWGRPSNSPPPTAPFSSSALATRRAPPCWVSWESF